MPMRYQGSRGGRGGPLPSFGSRTGVVQTRPVYQPPFVPPSSSPVNFGGGPTHAHGMGPIVKPVPIVPGFVGQNPCPCPTTAGWNDFADLTSILIAASAIIAIIALGLAVASLTEDGRKTYNIGYWRSGRGEDYRPEEHEGYKTIKLSMNMTNGDVQMEFDAQQSNMVVLNTNNFQQTFLFSVSTTSYPEAYVNDLGQQAGISYDLTRAACEAAQINCEFEGRATTECFRAEGIMTFPGPLINSGAVDGCVFWYPTIHRKNYMMFTDPISPTIRSTFYVKRDSGITSAIQLSGRPIAFRTGFFSDPLCASVYIQGLGGEAVSVANAPNFDTEADAIDSVMSGQTDALFERGSKDSLRQDLRELDIDVMCVTDGAAIMMRKDRTALRDLLNAGIKKLKSTGRFLEICEESAIANNFDTRDCQIP